MTRFTLALAIGVALATTPALAKDKWVTLLDKKTDMSTWDKLGDANWRTEKGVAVADSGNGFLVTKKDYKNFRLRAEFWVGPDANSGIYVHIVDTKPTIDTKVAYEINIWDERPEKDYATGALVGIAKVDPMPTTVGKWNTYEIEVKDGVFNIKLNGKATVKDAKDNKFPAGKIALQHGLGNKDASGKANDKGVVKFRKVQIQEL